MSNYQTASLSAADSFTETLSVEEDPSTVTLIITGSFSGTVTFQMRRPDGSWVDVYSVTEGTADAIDMIGPLDVRAGFKAGDYSSGSVYRHVVRSNDRLAALLSGFGAVETGSSDPIWLPDWNGVYREIPAGKATYAGGRVVYNLLNEVAGATSLTELLRLVALLALLTAITFLSEMIGTQTAFLLLLAFGLKRVGFQVRQAWVLGMGLRGKH